ncbi:hypothetical protein ACFX13_034151 [Malus domestica]
MASLIELSCFFFVIAHSLLLLSPLVQGADKDEDNLLQGINSYRTSLNLPALVKNGNAGCLAEQIADDMEDQPCSSPTNGANILATTPTPLANLPKHLSKCKIDANSTSAGVILPICVPHLVPTLVLTNYTHRPQFAECLNDSKFTGVGLGSEDDWMVVVLATNNPAGSFANAASSLVSTVDEEDKLFQSLNNFRQSQKLPEFKKNDNAACLADKLADKLEHRQCSSSQKYSIEPGNGPKFPKFDKLRRRCHIETNSTTAGIIWPVCVPDLDEDLVLNNYTRSHYAKYLKDSKYAGVGIGSEDDWVIVVLTTDAQSGSFASGAASLGAIGMIHYMAAVLVGLFLVLLC